MYTFEDLKDNDVLVMFLEEIWKDGCMTGVVNHKESVHHLTEKYMPDFKTKLMRDASKNNVWFSVNDKPHTHRWIIVRDKEGREFKNHEWNGFSWYEYVGYCEGGYDGHPSDVEIVEWRYDND